MITPIYPCCRRTLHFEKEQLKSINMRFYAVRTYLHSFLIPLIQCVPSVSRLMFPDPGAGVSVRSSYQERRGTRADVAADTGHLIHVIHI